MLFNSFEFFLFLPVVFITYWLLNKSLKAQNLFILAASYLFYGLWSWKFLILIAFTSLCSYIIGILIEHYEGWRKLQKALSTANIIINIGILSVYKYYDFFATNISSLVKNIFNYDLGWATLHLVLPVGISFYTFQALSYTIDVYQRKIKPSHDIIEFFAYVSFFPQLVAGPIERATNLLPQFKNTRKFEYAKAVDGLRQMLWGFFKKIVVADLCALNVDAVWGDYHCYSSLTLIVILILFSVQMYCDFSGYSDIAIGCARLFGINLTKNFDFPYFSRNISEFWRKWHISLMTWFRDYVYIPLGGSRCSKVKLIRNIFIVFILSGVWHKAGWTYVAWGLYHASFISLIVLFNMKTKYNNTVAYNRTLPTLKEIVMMLSTFVLVIISRVFSRSSSISESMDYMRQIVRGAGDEIYDYKMSPLLITGVVMLFIVEWIQRNKVHGLQFNSTGLFGKRIVRWSTYYFVLLLIWLSIYNNNAFIYFQF